MQVPVTYGNRTTAVPIATRGISLIAAKQAAYNRAMRDNTVAWMVEEGNDYTPSIPQNTKTYVAFDTPVIDGRMYHDGTYWFHPQTEGQHEVNVVFAGELPISNENLPGYADAMLITNVNLWLVKRAVDNSLEYIYLGSAYGNRYWDSRTDTFNYSLLWAWCITPSVTVDHKHGISYALAWDHNGAGSITTMQYFYAYMSMHYYGKALIATDV